MSEQSGFIEGGDRGLYCTAFLPESQAQLGVVVVEPLGEEKRAAYRMLVRLCRRLAQAGVAALKFDLSGTGDSTLPHEQVDLDIWLDDLALALRELGTLSGCRELGLVCARGGALLGGKAASLWSGLPLRKLVLVEPWFEGQDYLNDLERRQSIKSIMSGGGESAGTPSERWARGETVDFGGYAFSSGLASGLSGLSLSALAGSYPAELVPWGIRVSPSKRLPPAWSWLGERVTLVSDKPFWGQLDYYESDLVNDAIVSSLGVTEK